MAATIDIEVESGIDTRPFRRHRGYYAGDFSARPLPTGCEQPSTDDRTLTPAGA